jgi:Holliday junction resolvase RusA-like endonuclease
MNNRTPTMSAADYRASQTAKPRPASSGAPPRAPQPQPAPPEAPAPEVLADEAVRLFTFFGKVPGNNGAGGLLRLHWSRRQKLLHDYEWQVAAAHRRAPPLAGPVRLELTRYSTGSGMDYDNLVSTGKLLIDALVRAGVLPDDNPAVLVERTYSQCHVSRTAQQRTEIRLTHLAVALRQQQ